MPRRAGLFKLLERKGEHDQPNSSPSPSTAASRNQLSAPSRSRDERSLSASYPAISPVPEVDHGLRTVFAQVRARVSDVCHPRGAGGPLHVAAACAETRAAAHGCRCRPGGQPRFRRQRACRAGRRQRGRPRWSRQRVLRRVLVRCSASAAATLTEKCVAWGQAYTGGGAGGGAGWRRALGTGRT